LVGMLSYDSSAWHSSGIGYSIDSLMVFERKFAVPYTVRSRLGMTCMMGLLEPCFLSIRSWNSRILGSCWRIERVGLRSMCSLAPSWLRSPSNRFRRLDRPEPPRLRSSEKLASSCNYDLADQNRTCRKIVRDSDWVDLLDLSCNAHRSLR
jgi:hypothetical protein